MDARGKVPAAAELPAFPEEDFLTWLGEPSTPALISERHKQYYAYCFEFGIAGSGATRDEAIEDASDLLVRYLVVSFSEGRPYQETKKSPPLLVRLRSWYLVAQTKLLRIKPSLSRLGGLISVPTTNHDAQRLAH
jgi:predicted RNase H-like HicB family nuclease